MKKSVRLGALLLADASKAMLPSSGGQEKEVITSRRLAAGLVGFTTACAGIGHPCMIKPAESSSGKGQSKIKTVLPRQ